MRVVVHGVENNRNAVVVVVEEKNNTGNMSVVVVVVDKTVKMWRLWWRKTIEIVTNEMC